MTHIHRYIRLENNLKLTMKAKKIAMRDMLKDTGPGKKKYFKKEYLKYIPQINLMLRLYNPEIISI
jgi:hypothetical protein